MKEEAFNTLSPPNGPSLTEVDMKTQGDSIYDIIDKRDHATVQAQLLQGGASASKSDQDLTFFCRMNMSRCLKRQTGPGDIKIMHVKGHFASVPATDGSGEKSVFLGLCSPLITPDIKENLIQNNTLVFKSVHSLDMKFLELTETGEHYLGLTNDQIFRKSWYAMLHPEDLSEAREKHVQLIRSRHEMGCMMTVRMIAENGDLFWVNVVMHVRQGLVPGSNDPVIVCVNQVVSDQEAYHFKIQSQLYSLHATRGPDYFCHPGYPGSSSPGMEGEMYMQSYQIPGYYPPAVMSYPSPSGNYGNYVVPEQFSGSCTFNQSGIAVPCGEPTDKRENCTRKAEHAQAVEALKRKLGENGPCRGKKASGMSVSHNGGYPPGAGHFGCVSNGLTSHNQGYLIGGVANNYNNPTQSYSYGPTQVMASPMNGHIPDLCFSLKGEVPDTSTLATFKASPVHTNMSMSPGLPPTPDPSPTSKTATVTPGIIKTETSSEVLPDWYLTPEASPGSPSSVSEEDVTAFARKLEAKIEAELIGSCQQQQQSPSVFAISLAKKRKTNRDLPVMDGSTVDNFFEAVIGEKLEILPQASKENPLKIPKREIPFMEPMDIESFFRQSTQHGFQGDQANHLSRPISADVQIVPDQSNPSPSYGPASVEGGDYLADEMSSGGIDQSRVTMTVSVALAEPHTVDHTISHTLGIEENDEMLNQLLSWASNTEAHPAPDPNQ
ncbi:uncharacterized protein LOC135468411 isoform X2 [Liolophura sinensis]|uniref:uncharacterized protein LOC135468411 isoform X2 n=1 Tax=Liolophura sinensis TaxID=3198878 RepID=UPI0031595B60